MHEKSLSIGLFDPGMTDLHRVGLAGLYMTLKSLNPDRYKDSGAWDLSPQRVNIHWKKRPEDFFKPLFNEAFGISTDGCITFKAHRKHPMGNLERFLLHQTIRLTYLQHPRVCTTAKAEKAVQFDFQDKIVTQIFKPVIEYGINKAKALDNLLFASGELKQAIPQKGWLFLGGTRRHEVYSITSLSSPPTHFIPLLFAPVASLYFHIIHKNRDGRWDKRRKAAVVLPHICNLETYCRSFERYLRVPARRLYADGLGDAALLALSLLQSQSQMLGELGISACSVMIFGSTNWNQRQESRTGLLQITSIDTEHLNFFAIALASLENRVVFKDDGSFYVVTSPSRGLIAENIAAGKDWFRDFYQLMMSKELTSLVWRERKGLNDMMSQMEWNHEADRCLVEAVHHALRNRYGALAKRAQEKGEKIQFGREFERIRSSLMRAKNAQTMRAELADLFARGGLNKTLQQSWPDLLPLFTGDDWQRAKDLSLLALASYVGQGADTVTEPMDGKTLEEGERE